MEVVNYVLRWMFKDICLEVILESRLDKRKVFKGKRKDGFGSFGINRVGGLLPNRSYFNLKCCTGCAA